MSTLASSITGVFFDLGGTLFSYRHIARSNVNLLLEAADRMQITAEPRLIKKSFGQATDLVTQSYADEEFYLQRDFFQDIFVCFTELLNVPYDADAHAWYRRQNHAAMLDSLVLMPRCLETLHALKEAGLYLAICSNIDDDMLEPLVAREGLDRYFDHWTSSEAASACKPHARFFEVCLAKSGLAPEQVLFVGDSPEHDIAGASAIGMQTALIQEAGQTPPLQSGRATPTPDYILESLAEIMGFV